MSENARKKAGRHRKYKDRASIHTHAESYFVARVKKYVADMSPLLPDQGPLVQYALHEFMQQYNTPEKLAQYLLSFRQMAAA